LCECEHEDGAEAAREKPQKPGPEAAAKRLANVVAEQIQPMGFMPALGISKAQQDVALFALAAAGEVAIDSRFGPLIRQILTPPPDLHGAGHRKRGGI
jgi:hypothetical protein